MSTAPAEAGVPPAKGKKKLIIMLVAVVLLLAAVGVGAMVMLKARSHVDEGADDEHASPAAPAVAVKLDPRNPPTYVPLDPFTVNLADKQADRYAQVAMTLELGDASTADAIKAFMPAVRNNILLTLAHKTAVELMEPEGKSKLADDIRRETARALGMEIEVPEAADDEAEDDAKAPKKKKKKARKPPQVLPVTAVYFSTFIIQ